jgi:hypothetical protein
MARGWESKHIEAQQDEASRRGGDRRPELGPEERTRLAERRQLELARERAVADLGLARAPAHRATLQAAIAALDGQLRKLDGGR